VPASPSVATSIGATGLRGKVTGVTRFGSRAGLIVVGLLAALGLAIVYGVTNSGGHRAATAAAAAAPAPQILPTADLSLGDIPGANATAAPAKPPQTVQRPANSRAHRPPALPAPALPDGPAPQSALVRTQDVPDIHALPQNAVAQAVNVAAAAVPDAAALRKAQLDQQAAQVAAASRQAAEAARHASIIVSTGSSNTAAAADARTAPIQPATTAPAAAATVADAAAGTATDPTTASQRAKNEFLSLQKSTTASDYLTTPRQAAISPYEVQAGSIIPAILVTGINSDLPGQMIGQVSQNVYDSKTGTYLLIPAGSKLVGRYDSQVSNGQSRVLVAWQRIIFPDSSFIDINGMSGADTAGYTGLTGKVDDHSGKLFRNAILSSLIGVGAALLQPRTALTALTPVGAVMTTPSVGSQVAGQVGTQVAQVAQQSATQGVQAAPTIEVRPGYLFNILVDRDLVLPGPYTK
jgi:type IV secretion system protein VirB10